jgi:hypothetical protein
MIWKLTFPDEKSLEPETFGDHRRSDVLPVPRVDTISMHTDSICMLLTKQCSVAPSKQGSMAHSTEHRARPFQHYLPYSIHFTVRIVDRR